MYQNDLFGNEARCSSWRIIIHNLEEKYHDIGKTKEEHSQFIRSAMIAETSVMRRLVKVIGKLAMTQVGAHRTELDKETLEQCNQALLAAFVDPEMPSFETVARGYRQVMQEREEQNLLHYIAGPTSKPFPSLYDIATKAEAANGEYYSSIETRFGTYLKEQLPDWGWQENRNQTGVWAKPDFVSESQMLSIEIDSWEYHRGPSAFERDRQKSRAMQAKGYRHIQFTASELSINGSFERALQEIRSFRKA